MNESFSRRQFIKLGIGTAFGASFGNGLPLLSHNEGVHDTQDDSFTKIIRHVHTNVRKVSITYDDLWNEYNTTRICREYFRREIRLTLFPVGQAVYNNLERPNEGYEDLYPAIKRNGP